MADPDIPALVTELRKWVDGQSFTYASVLMEHSAAALSRLTRELAEQDHWTAELERRLRYLESHSLLSLEAERATALRERDDVTALYHDLLYQVGNKYPGETRHETARRYIREREQGSGLSAKAAPVEPPPAESWKE